MAPYVVVRSIPGERYTQSVETGKHRLFADKQTSFGGSDRGPGPYAYLLAAFPLIAIAQSSLLTARLITPPYRTWLFGMAAAQVKRNAHAKNLPGPS